MYNKRITYTVKYYLDEINPPDKIKASGKSYLKSIDYYKEKSQVGWAVDLLKGGKDTNPFVCTICLGVPKFPVEVLSCGDIFCYDCIESLVTQHLKEKGIIEPLSCPNCKLSFEPNEIQEFAEVSKALYRIFTSIDISCSYGCGLVTSTKSLIVHEMWECPNRPVKCPNNCNKVLPDSEMEKHIDSCEKRIGKIKRPVSENIVTSVVPIKPQIPVPARSTPQLTVPSISIPLTPVPAVLPAHTTPSVAVIHGPVPTRPTQTLHMPPRPNPPLPVPTRPTPLLPLPNVPITDGQGIQDATQMNAGESMAEYLQRRLAEIAPNSSLVFIEI